VLPAVSLRGNAANRGISRRFLIIQQFRHDFYIFLKYLYFYILIFVRRKTNKKTGIMFLFCLISI